MNKAITTVMIAIASFILGGFLVFQLDQQTYAVLPPATHSKSINVNIPKTVIVDPDLDMLTLINQARILADIPEVQPSLTLNKTAMIKACDMRDRNYFDHRDPDGKMPWHLFIKAGYYYDYAGENLVEGSTNPMADMFYLMASQGHRENLLNPNYTEVGIATCGTYTVQHFGDPK